MYVERVLAAPSLRPGQEVVVMDNLLSAHKGEEVRELIEARGCELLFVPPYSYSLRLRGREEQNSQGSRVT